MSIVTLMVVKIHSQKREYYKVVTFGSCLNTLFRMMLRNVYWTSIAQVVFLISFLGISRKRFFAHVLTGSLEVDKFHALNGSVVSEERIVLIVDLHFNWMKEDLFHPLVQKCP